MEQLQKEKKKLPKPGLVPILTFCYMIPTAFFLAANLFFSLTQTTYMELYLDTEKPLYKADSPLLLLLGGLLFLILAAWFIHKYPATEKLCRQFEHGSLIFAGTLCLFIIFLFRVRVACDSASLSEIAIAFLNGDYSSLTGDNYLVHYPHQLGMIGLFELVYFLFGTENFIVLQFINLLAILSVICFLHRISRELFNDNRIQLMLSLLCMGLLPLYLYVTFLYGDVSGMGLALPALYCIMRYLNTRNRKLLLPASLCMGLAMLLKSNNSVLLAAMILILLLHTLKEKDLFAPVMIIGLVFASFFGTFCVNAWYKNASGLAEIPAGVPKIAWVAMGLQENEYLENGWYNGYNWVTYTTTGHDAAATTQASLDSIRESLQSFLSAPRSSGLAFFYKKFISQWNDPGYQSQLTIEWYSRHRDDQSELALYLIYGNGRFLLEGIMNFYHFLILLGAVIFSVRSLKKWSLPSALLLLCVFGGYFFHMFWEACGRYALSYFVLCVPMAACGLTELAKAALHLVQHSLPKKSA